MANSSSGGGIALLIAGIVAAIAMSRGKGQANGSGNGSTPNNPTQPSLPPPALRLDPVTLSDLTPSGSITVLDIEFH